MKPKYNIFSNSVYALEGIYSMWCRETSFRVEVFCIIPLIIFSFLLDISLVARILIITSMLFILVVECINSAIEATVDLNTEEIHPLAKIAKDCASSAVFFSIVSSFLIWVTILIDLFYI